MKRFLLPVWLKMSVSGSLAPLKSISQTEISINFSDDSFQKPFCLGLPQYNWYKIFLCSVLLLEGLKMEVCSLFIYMMGRAELEKFLMKYFFLPENSEDVICMSERKSYVLKNCIYCVALESDWSHINGKHPN